MTSENPEGNFERGIKPLPQQSPIVPTDPKKYKKYFNKNPVVKENGLRVVNSNWYNIARAGLIILFILVIGMFYLTYEGYTTSEINIPSCPNISIPDCSTTCGDLSCGNLECGDFYMPSNISINLVNGT